jgi:ureidoglycolate lyase
MHPAPSAARHVLHATPITVQNFAPFGDLICVAPDAPHRVINAGHAQRFDGLTQIDTDHAGGHAALSIFRASPWLLPLHIRMMERHLLGSQLFMPLSAQRFMVVVAVPGPAPSAEDLHCFLVPEGQGVNLARGTWHHPLLAMDAGGDFLVIERAGGGGDEDCEVQDFATADVWLDAA